MCDIKQKDSYRKLEPVDVNSGEKQILSGEEFNWSNDVLKFSKLDLLADVKNSFGTEKYLEMDLDRYDKSLLSQFRYGILPIAVETGRYKGLDRNERICTLCDAEEVENQIHFALKCSTYTQFRNDFVNTCRDRIVGWDILTDIGKISALFCHQPRLFGKYIKKIFLYRKSLLYK